MRRAAVNDPRANVRGARSDRNRISKATRQLVFARRFGPWQHKGVVAVGGPNGRRASISTRSLLVGRVGFRVVGIRRRLVILCWWQRRPSRPAERHAERLGLVENPRSRAAANPCQ